MRIARPINNNIVTAEDNGQEVIVIGTGIGFQAKRGAEIDPGSIQKVYRISDRLGTDQLQWMIAKLPPEYFELTDAILTHAREVLLRKRLNEGVFLTLADHINFAVERHRQGLPFQNVLLSEIRHFYTEEYRVGQYALWLMRERLGVSLPDDEAAAIALYILNAEYDVSVSYAFHAAMLLDHILVIVVEKTGYDIHKEDYYCERFISHLKYLTQCIVKKEALPQSDDPLYELLARLYPREARCCDAIARYVARTHDCMLPNEELTSLLVHIRRIGMRDEAQPEKEGFACSTS